MKRPFAFMMLIAFALSAPVRAKALTCVCAGDDGNITVSIITNDGGQLLDLAVVLDDQALITRFPEANSTSVDAASHSYRFLIGKKAGHDALDLDIKGTKGVMKFRGKASTLECDWQ